MDDIAFSDWPGPPVDLSGSNPWLPAYGYQPPSTLLDKDDFIGNPGGDAPVFVCVMLCCPMTPSGVVLGRQGLQNTSGPLSMECRLANCKSGLSLFCYAWRSRDVRPNWPT
ncbi:hypothetical protein CBL_07337 [Carabus blaptoides fortunei]